MNWYRFTSYYRATSNYLSCCVTDKNVARRPQADVAILKGNKLQAKNQILYEIATPRYGRGSQ